MQPSSDFISVARDEGARRLQGRLMAQSLQALLDAVRGAREVLPHLAALERGLIESGVEAVNRIPPHWLPKICSQLSSLPIPDGDAPLQELLDRLLQALREQQGEPHSFGGFDPERTVVIREISHSEFDAASAEQVTTVLSKR
jgi:hypothetical protein